MKSIKYVGEKRKRLSEIFNVRNEIVKALDNDDKSEYNAKVVELRFIVNRLESEP